MALEQDSLIYVAPFISADSLPFDQFTSNNWSSTNNWSSFISSSLDTSSSSSQNHRLCGYRRPIVDHHAHINHTVIPTFSQLLAGDAAPPYTLASFRSYLVSNFRQESLDFYVAVQAYSRLYSTVNSDALHYSIHTIAKTYLLPSSPYQLNLPSSIRDELLDIICSHLPNRLIKQISPSLVLKAESLHKYKSSSASSHQYVHPTAFEDAVTCVTDMLREGSFHDWLHQVWLMYPSQDMLCKQGGKISLRSTSTSSTSSASSTFSTSSVTSGNI